MHQHENIGGGEADDNRYETWEVKTCPTCKRKVKETYVAEVLNESQVDKLREDTDITIE